MAVVVRVRVIVKGLPVGIAALRRDGDGIDLTLYAGERITYRRARRRLMEAVLALDSPLIGKKLSDPLFKSMYDATPAGIRAAKNDPRLWGPTDSDSVGAEGTCTMWRVCVCLRVMRACKGHLVRAPGQRRAHDRQVSLAFGFQVAPRGCSCFGATSA